ncbi:MAG: hypothetical protein JSR44_01420 [Spirochaetes bacterium]|nr:hypothetical protein [Spirochaetota bacterium]
MLFGQKNIALDAQFDESEFENIFLRNGYPGEHGKKSATTYDDKAEIWALYDKKISFNGNNLLRQLRMLWGIASFLKIGARSAKNPQPRGVFQIGKDKNAQKIYFEGYAGNIADATRELIAIAPYDKTDKARALDQKIFVRLIVPMRGKTPLQKIDAILAAYSIAAFLDSKHFVGIVDPDMYLFVPPKNIVAGLANYHRADRMLNTHLVTGFNFFQREGRAIFFTHGMNRFSLPDLLLRETACHEPLTTENYTSALKTAHAFFLAALTQKSKPKKYSAVKDRKTLPEQVNAMVGKNLIEFVVPATSERQG